MRNYHSRHRQGGWWQYLIPIATAAIGALSGSKSVKEANEQNRENAKAQMDFQERMSGTSYQRGVADMQAAGLNPMLAYSQGGASTPSGSMSTSTPTAVGAAAGVSSANQAVQSVSAIQGMMQSSAQTEQAAAQTEKIKSETMERDINTARLMAEVKEKEGQAGVREVEEWLARGTREYAAKKIQANADIEEFEARARERTFSEDVARRKSESRFAGTKADLADYERSEAKTRSNFYESDLGQSNPYLKMLIDVVKGLSSAKSLSR